MLTNRLTSFTVGNQHSPFVNHCEIGVEPHYSEDSDQPCGVNVVALLVSSGKSHETWESYFIMQRGCADLPPWSWTSFGAQTHEIIIHLRVSLNIPNQYNCTCDILLYSTCMIHIDILKQMFKSLNKLSVRLQNAARSCSSFLRCVHLIFCPLAFISCLQLILFFYACMSPRIT